MEKSSSIFNSLLSSNKIIEYKKETIESTLEEVNAVEEEIKSLIPTLVLKNNIEIRVKSTLMFTMVDGKVCNTMTGSSSQKCYICKCSPKDMNDITRAKNLSVQPELEFKKWQVRTSDDKVIFEKRKKYIQDRFRTETDLLIDVVLQGKGTTNDGNTARRFFKNAELTSAITNVDLQLIKRFGVILKTMSSGYEINLEKFEAYTLETAELYVSLYPWYYMPASVHKILIHGTDVIRSALLPIGQLSKEAQEARNKDFRNIRQNSTRQINRILQNEDLGHMLLVSSDPYISSLKKTSKMNLKSFDEDIRALLIVEGDKNSDSDSDSDKDDDSE
ncbi:uncharacterized protein LOC111031499 [Myzus persicae]|uniref:uncharacterized protein LOC111031499 n=1 Tax=Myzus persicae TaxID=13164 RepID=UPI000B933A72|nr:uncharacterized protein LOC111031499 [Myzus persicae]